MSDPYIGQINIFGFNFAPVGWAQCQGQMMSISQNTALFSLLGTMYGGNGQTTFALPNLSGGIPLGVGQRPGGSTYVQGQMAGTETVTLTTANMPAHTHSSAGLTATTTLKATTDAGGTGTPAAGAGLCAAPSGPTAGAVYLSPTPTANLVALGNVATTLGGNVTPAGSNIPVGIMNPFLALNFSIALEGIYPSRN